MTDANSAARVYQRIVPRPVRAVAGSRVPPRVRRKVKGGLVRTLNRREARLHQRALRLVRKGDFASASERRTRTPDGRVGHVHRGLTVDLARRLDHDLVTSALDAAEIPWFAVPALDDRRICIAVEQQDKGQVRRVLRALLEEHTGYVVSASPVNDDTRMTPGSHLKAWKNYGRAKAIRVVWLRTEPTENLWVGEDQGIEIEFWTVNTDLSHERLVGPRPNRVQRVVPRDAMGIEIAFDRLSGYSDIDGDLNPSVTLEAFDIPRLEEISFPVDAVLLWEHPGPWGEELLRATLRSLHQYAPWTDVIHVVAHAPVPPWLADFDGRLAVVHRHPADGLFHLIPDIAEHFLLFRPGALLGRPTRPFDYFMPDGTTRPRQARWTAEESFAPWTAQAYATTGRAVTQSYAPGPQPYSCSVLGRLANTGAMGAPAPDGQTHPRLPDCHPADGLFHHFAYAAGQADPSGEPTAVLHAALPDISLRLQRLLVRRDLQQLQFFGLGSDEALLRGGGNKVVAFLRRYFPVASPFEHAHPEDPETYT
ncbi:sugar phosphotransferase [Streptomyces rubiginosohelvolus]|uniref:sugar phosphotransferase n=1 Tax=Streptomyces TaxID=1883 RepID=UPI000B5CC900|nr:MULTISPECIES: sugar phosphotransferase [unclassified Streptomyces]MBK3530969.1 sugar phosphotransferase [Streptomyces sp. MBT72]MBK3536957.1 sugar phosphotransferase [Streptomyces sp. MBT67]MBK6030348.1 sugar phosphotransferase [Streptomyces sp. MBT59]